MHFYVDIGRPFRSQMSDIVVLQVHVDPELQKVIYLEVGILQM